MSPNGTKVRLTGDRLSGAKLLPIARFLTLLIFFFPTVQSSVNASTPKKDQEHVKKTASTSASPEQTAFFKELVKLVTEEKWFFVFHKLDDFGLSEVYKKSIHGNKSTFRKLFVKALLENPALKEIRNEVVFRNFLNKIKGIHHEDPCEDLPDAEGSPTADPVFDALKRFNRTITKDIYVEGFGGKKAYEVFLQRQTGDNILQLPLGLGGWTRFCPSSGTFWLSHLGRQWATLLAERKKSIDRAFAKGKLSLEDAVELGNWYIQHASNGGSLTLDLKSARLTIKKGDYHLSDSSAQINALVISGKTRTVIRFDWYLED